MTNKNKVCDSCADTFVQQVSAVYVEQFLDECAAFAKEHDIDPWRSVVGRLHAMSTTAKSQVDFARLEVLVPWAATHERTSREAGLEPFARARQNNAIELSKVPEDKLAEYRAMAK